MAKRQVFEAPPRTELIGSCICAKEQVLMTDSMHTLTIQSGFVGRYHARKQRLGIEIMSDFLRALMDIQEKTYAVTCSVTEISLEFPKRRARRIIYLGSGSTGREHGSCEPYMSLKDKGIILFLQIRTWTERNSTCNIGRPEKILSTRVT